MNFSCGRGDQARLAAYFAAIAGSFLIIGGLAWLMAQKTRPPGVDQARAELRRKNLAELRAADKIAQETYGWIDPAKGIVRLPLDRALELSLALWQDPTAARSNLLARLEKATAKPPEKPSEYE
jgi:hypothetical protein